MKHLFSMTVLFAFFCTMSVEAMEIQENEAGPSSSTIKKALSKSPFEDYKRKGDIVTIKTKADEILKFSKYKRNEEEEERPRYAYIKALTDIHTFVYENNTLIVRSIKEGSASVIFNITISTHLTESEQILLGSSEFGTVKGKKVKWLRLKLKKAPFN